MNYHSVTMTSLWPGKLSQTLKRTFLPTQHVVDAHLRRKQSLKVLPVFVCEELPFEAVRRVTGISAKVWEAGAKLKRLNEGSNVHHCLLPRKQAPSAPLRKVWDYFHEECSLVQIDKQTKVAWIEIISSPDSKLSASTIVNCSDFRLQKCFD